MIFLPVIMMFLPVIMMFLPVIMMFELTNTVKSECYTKDQYRHSGQNLHKCFVDDLIRSIVNREEKINHKTTIVRGEQCCIPPVQWTGLKKVAVYMDISEIEYPDGQWDVCPSGYFLSGFLLSTNRKIYLSDFSNIIRAQCIKPDGHPLYYGNCYGQKVNPFFKSSGREVISCREGHYLTGLARMPWLTIMLLKNLKCCSLPLLPQEVQTFEDMKTQIMQRTLVRMACLAEALGYFSCQGDMGTSCGEDFIKVNDSWEGGTSIYGRIQNCTEPECNTRLHIVYNHWGLEVNYIGYGKSSVVSVQPETKFSPKISNNARTRMTVSLDLTKYESDTVIHTLAKSISTGPEQAVDLDFHIPLPNRIPLHYKTKVQLTDSDVAHISVIPVRNTNRKIFVHHVEPNSSTRYKLVVNKTRTTVPYTADVTVRFSAKYSGYLRWKDSNDSQDVNYHYLYSENETPVYVEYRFGSDSVTFPEAVYHEVLRKSKPWMWEQIVKQKSFDRVSFASLISRNLYEFKINGTLEVISESVFDVVEVGETEEECQRVTL